MEKPHTVTRSAEERERREVRLPDLGAPGRLTVDNVYVCVGDVVAADDSLVVVTSAECRTQITGNCVGEIEELHVCHGSQVVVGSLLVTVRMAR